MCLYINTEIFAEFESYSAAAKAYLCAQTALAFWGFLDGDERELKKKKSQKLILLFMMKSVWVDIGR